MPAIYCVAADSALWRSTTSRIYDRTNRTPYENIAERFFPIRRYAPHRCRSRSIPLLSVRQPLAALLHVFVQPFYHHSIRIWFEYLHLISRPDLANLLLYHQQMAQQIVWDTVRSLRRYRFSLSFLRRRYSFGAWNTPPDGIDRMFRLSTSTLDKLLLSSSHWFRPPTIACHEGESSMGDGKENTHKKLEMFDKNLGNFHSMALASEYFNRICSH